MIARMSRPLSTGGRETGRHRHGPGHRERDEGGHTWAHAVLLLEKEERAAAPGEKEINDYRGTFVAVDERLAHQNESVNIRRIGQTGNTRQ
jgi:hypothetical protein